MKSAEVMREGGLVVSDHAPVIVDFDVRGLKVIFLPHGINPPFK